VTPRHASEMPGRRRSVGEELRRSLTGSSVMFPLLWCAAFFLLPADLRGQSADELTVWEEAAAVSVGVTDTRSMELGEFVARRDLAGAVALAEQILASNALDPAANHVVRLSLYEQGDFDGLLRVTDDCRPAVQQQERSCEFFRSLALARVGRVDEAIALLSATVQFADNLPGAAWYRSNLAELLMARGDLRLAGILYGRALAQQPDYLPAHAGQVAVALMMGQSDRARALFRDAWAASDTLSGASSMDSDTWVVDGVAQVWALLVGQVSNSPDLAALEQAVASSTLGRQLPSGTLDALIDQPVRLLDTARLWTNLPCLVTRAALSADGERAGVVCATGEVWESAVVDDTPIQWDGVERGTLTVPPTDLAWSGDGRLWLLGADSSVHVWQREAGPAVRHELQAGPLNQYGEQMLPVALSPTGEAVLLAGELYAYELRCTALSTAPIATLSLFEYDSVLQPVIDGGCRRAAWISAPGVAWGAGSSRESTFALPGESVRNVALDVSGARLYVGTHRRVWELQSGSVLRWIEPGVPVVDLMATDIATLVVTTSDVIYWPR